MATNRIETMIVGGQTMALGADYSYLDGQVTDVSTRLDDVSTRLGGAISDVSGLKERADAADTSIGILDSSVSSLNTALDTLTGPGTTEAIDTMKEIETFINSYKNTDNLASTLQTLETNLKAYTDSKCKDVSTAVDGSIGALAGDVYSKAEVDGFIAGKADASNVYAKSETYSQTEADAKFAQIKVVSSASEATDNSVVYFVLS